MNTDRGSPALIDRLRRHRLATLEQVYAVNGEPSEFIRTKHTPHLTPLMAQFIRRSPFFLIATANAQGHCDVSPKGDPAGSVHILDDRTLAIADRPGNRRVDGHRNLLQNPHIGLIFLVPPVDEAVRVNGRAFLSTDPELLASMPLQGKLPKLATIVEIDEVYGHCARPILRAGLWQPDTWADPDTVPTLAAMLGEQKKLPPPDPAQPKRAEAYRQQLY